MRTSLSPIVTLASLLISVNALADNLTGDEKFSITAGGYHVFRADTTLSLVSRNAGAGAALRPADTLNPMWNG